MASTARVAADCHSKRIKDATKRPASLCEERPSALKVTMQKKLCDEEHLQGRKTLELRARSNTDHQLIWIQETARQSVWQRSGLKGQGCWLSALQWQESILQTLFALFFFLHCRERCCVSSYKWIGSLFKSKCYEQQNTVVLYLIAFCHTMNMYIYFFPLIKYMQIVPLVVTKWVDIKTTKCSKSI